MTLRDKVAIAGIGSTPYYKRGQSVPQTMVEMAGKATLAAFDDAGLSLDELDGFALYCGPSVDPAAMATQLGIPDIGFAASVTGGGGGSAGSLGLGAAAIVSGQADVVVSLVTLQQTAHRLGGTSSGPREVPVGRGGEGGGEAGVSPDLAFTGPAGIIAPGHNFAMIANRHMYEYGTTREHFAEICIAQRDNAIRRPTSLMRTPLTMDDYFAARMICEPMCLFDCCLESDGAAAVVMVSAERARDLKQPAVLISGATGGGRGDHASLHTYFQMPAESFASAGNRSVARRVYEMAGVGPSDIDVALLYDHFSPMVLMQLEDYGFCPVGEGGPFVADGHIRWPDGSLPVNTHGGHLSEGYLLGMTHVLEAVEQLRGTAINQVKDAGVALVTGGPSAIPMSAAILRRAS